MTNGESESPGGATEIHRRLRDLVALPREDLQIELKGWLDLTDAEHAADLAKALLALANSGGGFVVIGFAEGAGGWAPDAARPEALTSFSQDVVNGIVAKYAEPVFHCQVHQVDHPEGGDLFPVVVVPGGHRVPVRAKADDPQRRHVRIDTYYIRRPGPSSDAPRTGREWDELIGRCVRAARDELIESIRAILEPQAGSFVVATTGALLPQSGGGRRSDPLDSWLDQSRARFEERLDAADVAGAAEAPRDRYTHGVCTVAYSLDGDFKPPALPEFRDVLLDVQGHETGWPPWLFASGDQRPVPVGEGIEAWLYDSTVFADPAHSDFWRASPKGFLYLLRGYDDDSYPDRFQPGTVFEVTLPIWEIAPCLLHAVRLAQALGDPTAQVRLRVIWEGLAGRRLSTWANPRRVQPSEREAVQDRVVSEVSVGADRIRDTLPEQMQHLTRDLYAAFDFFVPPPPLIREELARMRLVA